MEVSGAPAYENGVLYYPTADNGVLAVDADNLEVIRQFPTDYAAVLMPPYAHGKIKTVESTPQIIGDWLIFSACDGSVRFYDKGDGFLVNCIWIGAPCIATPIVGKDFVVTADFAGNVTKFRI